MCERITDVPQHHVHTRILWMSSALHMKLYSLQNNCVCVVRAWTVIPQ